MGLLEMIGLGGDKGTHSSLRCRRGFSESRVRWVGRGPSGQAGPPQAGLVGHAGDGPSRSGVNRQCETRRRNDGPTATPAKTSYLSSSPNEMVPVWSQFLV